MDYKKVNNLAGWAVCLFACAVYVLTMEATGSFWDCGEFVSSAYKLQIPHPPGAPLFVLMGRIFIILFGDNPLTAARAVNFMSAIVSGFSILFLFWSITHFARKMVQKGTAALDNQQIFTIITAGAVGALAYTFCDSFWYSAVEGEVYGSSSFFTALVFWAILKWEDVSDEPAADRWIIFIFYMMGLSIGVHLLNLLTIPAIIMVYYHKRYKPTAWGAVFAFLIGCVITGLVQKFIIQYTIKGAAWFDIKFVNSFGLPFFSGFAFFFLLITAGLVFLLKYAVRKKFYYLKIAVWCVSFMLIGYSTYFTTIIRSNADPAVDMFNVDNPVSLEGYLSREQYGDWPILYGPDYTDRAPRTEGGDQYIKGDGKYILSGKQAGQDWANTPSSHFFPRMWDNSNDRGQLEVYKQFGNVQDDAPNMGNNIRYFINYQVGWMFLRYFFWNFSGKQNDNQGFGNIRDGNAITGIPFIDNFLYGDQSKLPDSIHTKNKAYNRMYALPFILGMIGLAFHYSRHRQDFIINFLLFLFTGFAIVIYLNQAGQQPRERDYAYVGSFYAFAVWIGLGVIWVKEFLEKYLKKASLANYLAAAICLLTVPVLMGAQEWDDHDRSKKTLARDLAKDYLESCPPNAILFSFGDNDTYPLWYAQEVEGIRTDVRVVVNSLLGTDWYMNQLRYKINKSAPFDVIFTREQVAGNKRDAVFFAPLPGFDQKKYYDLFDIMKNVVGSDDPKYVQQQEDETYNLVPVHKFTVPVDSATVIANGTVIPGDSVLSNMLIDVPANRNYLLKNDLAIYSIIATNKWKRPICFTSTQELNDLGIANHVRQRGMSYQLVPVNNPGIDDDAVYKTVMEKFAYGNADKEGVYYDEENRRHLNGLRLAHSQLAFSLIDAGKKDSARKVLEHFDQNVKESNFPYGLTSNRGNQQDGISMDFIQAAFASGDTVLARKVEAAVKKDLQQQMRYYKGLGDEASDEALATNAYMILQQKPGTLSDKQMGFAQDIFTTYRMLMQIDDIDKRYNGAPAVSKQPLK